MQTNNLILILNMKAVFLISNNAFFSPFLSCAVNPLSSLVPIKDKNVSWTYSFILKRLSNFLKTLGTALPVPHTGTTVLLVFFLFIIVAPEIIHGSRTVHVELNKKNIIILTFQQHILMCLLKCNMRKG